MRCTRTLALLVMLPLQSYADNCSNFRDCFGTFQLAMATAVGLAILSFLLNFVPFIGTGKTLVESYTGRDLITGTKLEKWERVLGVIPGMAILGKMGYLAKVGDPLVDFLKKGTKVANVATEKGINQTSIAILKNGYYEVNGFKISDYYYNKLWNSGRGAPSLVAKEILEGSTYNGVADTIKTGFFKYTHGGWEMVYNPTTKEIWHLQPSR